MGPLTEETWPTYGRPPSIPGMHKHKCWKCGTVWEHPDTCGAVYGTHYCPCCSASQSWKYTGTEEADVTFFGSDRPSLQATLVIQKTLLDAK
jgi:hypothetical protein